MVHELRSTNEDLYSQDKAKTGIESLDLSPMNHVFMDSERILIT